MAEKIHSSWKDPDHSTLDLFFDGDYQELLTEELRKAGFWTEPGLISWPGRDNGIFGVEAMRVCLGTTDGAHPDFMAALRDAAVRCRESHRGGFGFTGW